MKSTGLAQMLILVLGSTNGQNSNEELNRMEKTYLNEPSVYQNYQNLQSLLTTRFEQLTLENRKRIRDLLGNAPFSTVTIYATQEPGKRIAIFGRLTDQSGKPISSSKIIFYHADDKGCYAPSDATTKRMSEQDARLYGVLRTNSKGEYKINTIRPGSYPFKYNGRFIPQHIHLNVSAVGFKPLNMQVVFDDDPAMLDEHWRDWAKEMEFPIVKLSMSEGINSGTCNIVLKK
jgi:protocatechuate 3,4-dioxygenase beta subunit